MNSYKSKNRASVLYVKEILENHSSIEKPLSNAEIRRILEGYPYEMQLHRETVKEILDELALYDEDLYRCETSDQQGRDGYSYGWYYNRSSSTYDNIKSIVDDLYYNPAIPSDIAKGKAGELMSLIPESYKTKSKKDTINENVFVRQNELNKEEYQLLNQLKQIIKDNKGNTKEEKYIRFNTVSYIIEKKKIKKERTKALHIEALPLAIVEWNYHYWLIVYFDRNTGGVSFNKNKIGHFRIDLICNVKVNSKPKEKNSQKKKAIEKVSTSDAIKKYMNEHIYFGNIDGRVMSEDDKVLTCTLRIKNSFGVTYFYDIFKDNFKVVEEKQDYYIVKIRCTQKTIENIVLLNPDLIECIGPEQVLSYLASNMEKLTKSLLINTNQALAKPRKFLFQEKMPGKVNDDEKWFYIDFNFDNVNDREKRYLEFIDYLQSNDFKEKALKKRSNGIANRYLVSNKYSSYNEVADLIKEYARKNHYWFYNYIKTYSIYEYKYGITEKGKSEKEFYRVYYYKGLNADLYPKISLCDYLNREFEKKKEKKNDK